MKTTPAQTHDFLTNIDAANAELDHAHSVCALLIDSHSNAPSGGFTMNSEIVIAAIADIDAKVRRIKDAVDGACEAWRAEHHKKQMAA